VYYKTFHSDGPTEASDWLYNNAGGFWSPSYRNGLNKRGQRVFDAVDFKLVGDNQGEYSSIERCILFMFEQDTDALRLFLECSRNDSCGTRTIFSIRHPSELKRYLVRKQPQKGGANTNAVLLEYSKYLRYPSRVALLRGILAAYTGSHAAYKLVRDMGRVIPVADDLRFSPHVDAYDPDLIVRFLLRQPTNVLARFSKKTKRTS
jgi:hypothetical protein